MEVFPMPLCPRNCSGHGSCASGTCVCEVQFTGGSCRDSNRRFFIPFGVVFYLICITSVIQLILCIRADFLRLNKANVGRAFRLTIQKLLYVFIIIATGSRALYFCVQEYIPDAWKNSLLSSYYPFIISGYSLIICFWAEIFHIGIVTVDRSRFLTKSSVACGIFNVFVYMLLFAQFVSSKLTDMELKDNLSEVFNASFAFLMFLVLVFFLIYGVEIFCKLKGEFANVNQNKDVNWRMAFQSRFGIVAQGVLQLATTAFLLIDVVGRIWKDKVAVGDRNIMEITFRVLELGVAMWFPCVLWNAHKPEELWLLNPKKLLLLQKPEAGEVESLLKQEKKDYKTFVTEEDQEGIQKDDSDVNCWICYDPNRTDAGLFISPCKCKGDISTVHHGCLKKWLLESVQDLDQAPSCKVCKTEYRVSEGYTWISMGFHKRAWLQSTFIILLIICAPVATGIGLHMIHMNIVKVIAICGLLLCEYVCFRLLGFNFVSAIKRARIQAFKILDFRTDRGHLVPDTAQQETEQPNQNPQEDWFLSTFVAQLVLKWNLTPQKSERDLLLRDLIGISVRATRFPARASKAMAKLGDVSRATLYSGCLGWLNMRVIREQHVPRVICMSRRKEMLLLSPRNVCVNSAVLYEAKAKRSNIVCQTFEFFSQAMFGQVATELARLRSVLSKKCLKRNDCDVELSNIVFDKQISNV